jgi:hypothetical protein
MIRTYDPCLIAKCCHEWRFLSAIKNPREFVLTAPFLCMCEWVGQVDYYLRLGKPSPDAKKKKTVIWSQERHCTLYILWVLESLFIQAARGYKRWVLYFYRSIKGDRTKREGSRYVWSHQSSSRKDHALFHPKHQMVRDRFKLQWGWAPVALDPKHLH